MQKIIALINQKGRGGKTAFIWYFEKEEINNGN